LDQKYALLSEAIKDKYRKEYKNEFIDELNTIYVSLTRAKSELYVFLSSGISRVNNVARFLIPQDYFKSEKRTGKNSARASEDITLQIDQARYWKWNKFLDQEFCDKDVFNKRQAILDGEILHSILSGIGNISGADKSTIVNGALAKTKGLFPQVDNFSQYEKLIYRVLDCDKFHEFFYLKKASIFQEKEIADRAGNAYRIDRLIVNSDKALVVDYKLKLDEGRDYRRQVLNYMDIIRPLFPGLEIKGFLLSLNEFKVEEVNG
jgi:ATP-dependent exoDNAse (exonuclease V) beta subunit